MLESFLALSLRPAGADFGRRQPDLLRGRHEYLDLRAVGQPEGLGRGDHGGDVERRHLALLAVLDPQVRRERQVLGDLQQIEVATPEAPQSPLLVGGELHCVSGRMAAYRQPGLSHMP